MHYDEDLDLIRRVQTAATGANIHRANKYLTVYRGCARLAKVKARGELERRERMRMRNMVKRIEGLLNIFLLTGYLPLVEPVWMSDLMRTPSKRKPVLIGG